MATSIIAQKKIKLEYHSEEMEDISSVSEFDVDIDELQFSSNNLKEELVAWVDQFKISSAAANSLLEILSHHVVGSRKNLSTLMFPFKQAIVKETEAEDTLVDGLNKEKLATKSDLEAITTRMDNINDNNLKAQKETQKLLKQILLTLHTNKPAKRTVWKPILPKTQFKTVSQFVVFEQKIDASEDMFDNLVADFKSIVSGNGNRFIKIAWRTLMSDDVARQFCWSGTTSKRAIKSLSVTAALNLAYNYKFSSGTDEEFERTNISFFQQANNRFQKKTKYSKEKEKEKDDKNDEYF